MTENIPIAGPWVSDLEVTYVTEAAREAWYRGFGSLAEGRLGDMAVIVRLEP